MRVHRSLARRLSPIRSRLAAPFSRPLAAAALFGGAVLFAGCRERVVQPYVELALDTDTVAFRTNATTYTVTRGDRGFNGQISAVYVNRTGKPVYIPNCEGSSSATLEKWQSGAWQAVYSPPSSLCLSVPFAVAPGSTHDFAVVMTEAFSVPGGERPSDDAVRGQYRVVWHTLIWDLLPDSDRSMQLPLALRHSNTFTIAPAP